MPIHNCCSGLLMFYESRYGIFFTASQFLCDLLTNSEDPYRNQIQKAISRFSKLDMNVNTISALPAAFQKGFHVQNQLTETL
jgi:hypothetical protein